MMFPDIEASAKNYSVQRCAAKAADFDTFELAKFIDEQFFMLTIIKKDADDSLIRSVKSCRIDLRRWGACFDSNSQRPYFKDSYYLISEDAQPKWQIPTIGTSIILIFHDESIFRSGEVSANCWLYGNQAPFYSEGRGRSNMLSDFLAMRNSGSFFQLSLTEYEKALQKYSELKDEQDIDL
ncbi:unnamed protein product [Rotaria sp. Silwood2]|nr:unnamed protein product [Rotaria sp. Silwood2]CAF3068527.1 unnamed protein product [Rotaria sp. Silwood2]CAF3898390.1 unnamed protein product [Rotaria sp. Silwood2]CAF4587836.1 unnamed protein product [Rotaria sp. Silwood2]